MSEWNPSRNKIIEMLVLNDWACQNGSFVNASHNGLKWDGEILKRTTVEIKVDWKAERTKNCYFEVRNTKQEKPSGLAATKADLWLFCLPCMDATLCFSPGEMRRYLRRELKSGRLRLSRPNGGDENSQGVLIPIQKLVSLEFVKWSPLTVDLTLARAGKETPFQEEIPF